MQLSHEVNTLLDTEREHRSLWYEDFDYVSLVRLLESRWRPDRG